jgi:hypothetical protein
MDVQLDHVFEARASGGHEGSPLVTENVSTWVTTTCALAIACAAR